MKPPFSSIPANLCHALDAFGSNILFDGPSLGGNRIALSVTSRGHFSQQQSTDQAGQYRSQ
jgi:hypothetical protein